MWKPSEDIVIAIHKDIVAGRTNYTKLWKAFNVSDNAVRKRFKAAWLEIPKKIKWKQPYTCWDCWEVFVDDVSREKASKTWIHFCNINCKTKRQIRNKNQY